MACCFICLDAEETMTSVWWSKNVSKSPRIAHVLRDKRYLMYRMVIQTVLEQININYKKVKIIKYFFNSSYKNLHYFLNSYIHYVHQKNFFQKLNIRFNCYIFSSHLPQTFRPASVIHRCWPGRRFVVCVRQQLESPSSDPPKLLGTSGPRVLPILPICQSISLWTTHPPLEIGLVRSWLQNK